MIKANIFRVKYNNKSNLKDLRNLHKELIANFVESYSKKYLDILFAISTKEKKVSFIVVCRKLDINESYQNNSYDFVCNLISQITCN